MSEKRASRSRTVYFWENLYFLFEPFIPICWFESFRQGPPNSVRICSHCSPCSTISKNELFALFVVRTVRPMWTVRFSHCSNCSSFALLEQFTRFAVHTVRYFRKKLLFAVRTVWCKWYEQRTRLFAARWFLAFGIIIRLNLRLTVVKNPFLHFILSFQFWTNLY